MVFAIICAAAGALIVMVCLEAEMGKPFAITCAAIMFAAILFVGAAL